MKLRTWIFAGLGVGLAAYIVFSRPTSRCAAENDGLESAGDRFASWGRKQRVAGAGTYAQGMLKRWFGRVMGNHTLVGEGIVDQVAGAACHTAGEVASSVGDVLHDVAR